MVKAKWLRGLLVLCLLPISGCASSVQTEEEQPQSTPTSVVAESAESPQDYTSFQNTKILVEQEAPLYRKTYDGDFVETGTISANTLLDVGMQDSDYLLIVDSSYYVKGSDVQVSNRWFQEHTNFIPFNQVLHTKDSYHLQDDLGNVLLTVNGTADYVVYVQPSAEDGRYGIRFENAIYFIPSEEVDSVEDAPVEGADQTEATKIPVLMYHFFYSKANGETGADANWLEVNDFQSQLQYLQDNNYATLTMREVEYFMQQRARIPFHSLAITIDDNNDSVHTYAYPLLKQYGMHATLFVIGGWAGESMSYDLWEMREEGIELQSHSFLMHQGGCEGEGHGGRLLCASTEEGVEDTIRSFDFVGGGFVYCYPFGDVNAHAKDMIQQGGAILAFTTKHGWITPGMDLLELPRVRIHAGDSLDQFIHGISQKG